jgi:hypothetical protein
VASTDENAKLKKLLAEPMWTPPRSASFSQKNGRARRQAKASRIFRPRWACRNGGLAPLSMRIAR